MEGRGWAPLHRHLQGKDLSQGFFFETLILSLFVLYDQEPWQNNNLPQGAQYGIVRLSTAFTAVPSSSLFRPRPGMGLKLLRDSVDSANVVIVIENIIVKLS